MSVGLARVERLDTRAFFAHGPYLSNFPVVGPKRGKPYVRQRANPTLIILISQRMMMDQDQHEFIGTAFECNPQLTYEEVEQLINVDQRLRSVSSLSEPWRRFILFGGKRPVESDRFTKSRKRKPECTSVGSRSHNRPHLEKETKRNLRPAKETKDFVRSSLSAAAHPEPLLPPKVTFDNTRPCINCNQIRKDDTTLVFDWFDSYGTKIYGSAAVSADTRRSFQEYFRVYPDGAIDGNFGDPKEQPLWGLSAALPISSIAYCTRCISTPTYVFPFLA